MRSASRARCWRAGEILLAPVARETAGFESKRDAGAQVILIDRPVGATVTRVIAGLRELTFTDARRCLSAGLSATGSAADMRELTRTLNPLFGPGAARLDAVQLARCRQYHQTPSTFNRKHERNAEITHDSRDIYAESSGNPAKTGRWRVT